MSDPLDALEERKHSLERDKFEHSRDFDRRRLSSEHFTRMAGSFSIMVPVILLMLSHFATSYQERQARGLAMEQARVQVRIEEEKAKLAKVDLQITKLYSPLKGKLDKDTDIWRFYQEYRKSSDPSKKDVSRVVERDYMLPNYAAISKILEDNYDLIPIDPEDQASYQSFLSSINAYQRYFVVLSAKRHSSRGDTLTGLDDGFPAQLIPEVDQRLALLFEQRKTIADEVSRLRTGLGSRSR